MLDYTMNAWWCPCGEYGMASAQPAAARALAEHLVTSGHRYGEYFYGCTAQRTAVGVHFNGVHLRHELLPR